MPAFDHLDKKPDDFCIGSETQYSVRDFVNKVANKLNIKIFWKGVGLNEKGYDQENNLVVSLDPRYFRPSEVDTLLADTNKAKKLLGWNYQFNLDELIDEMISSEL